MREILLDDRGPERGGPKSAAAVPARGTPGMPPPVYPMEGRFVCPFCGAVNETADGPCPRCTMENTAEARKATKSRIGPWYVLQTRNPAAPGMKYETLLGFVRKGRVKARSIVRGPTTHQLWRFACQVKGLSREFGVCYSCGGSIERDAQICGQCNRLQDPPPNPDVFVEGQTIADAPAATAGVANGGFPGTGITFDTPASDPSEPVVDRTPAAPPLRAAAPATNAPVFKELKVPAPQAPAPQAPAAPAPAPAAVQAPAPTPAPSATPRPQPPIEFPFGEPTGQQAAATSPAAAQTAAAAAPAPGVADRPRKRPNDVFLSARDLAAAFQLGFDVDGENDADLGDEAPWRAGQAGGRRDNVATLRPTPRPRRRKRRLGRTLFLLLLLGGLAFAGYLAIDSAFRARTFEWVNAQYMKLTGADLHPDLAGASPAAPARSPSRAQPGVGDTPSGVTPSPASSVRTTAPAPVASGQNEAAVRPQLPSTRVAAATDGTLEPAPRRDPSPPAPERRTVPRGATGARGADVAAPTTRSADAARGDRDAGATDATALDYANVGDATAPKPTQRQVQVQPQRQTPRPAETQPAREPVGERRPVPPDRDRDAAGSAPKPAPAPAPAEDPSRKAFRLYRQAMDAEDAGDYRKAKGLYEQVMTLPKTVWPADLESRHQFAKKQLGER